MVVVLVLENKGKGSSACSQEPGGGQRENEARPPGGSCCFEFLSVFFGLGDDRKGVQPVKTCATLSPKVLCQNK